MPAASRTIRHVSGAIYKLHPAINKKGVYSKLTMGEFMTDLDQICMNITATNEYETSANQELKKERRLLSLKT